VLSLGNLEVRCPIQQAVHRDPSLSTRQWRAWAGVGSAAERHVLTHVAPVGPEFMGIVELFWITVTGTGQQHNDRPRRNVHLADASAGARQPEMTFHWALHPQRFFQARGDQGTVAAQLLMNVWPLAHHP